LNGNPKPPNAPKPAVDNDAALVAEKDEAATPAAPTPTLAANDAGMLNAMIITTSIDSTAIFFKVLIQSPLLDIVKVQETIINILLYIKTNSSRFRFLFHTNRLKNPSYVMEDCTLALRTSRIRMLDNACAPIL
jgi:hypothetical protein